MSKYFNNFNKINYTLPIEGKTRNVVNIFNRFQPIRDILNRVTIFYDYTIVDGDTPAIVSHKFYDTYDHHWLIMMFNQRFDQYFDWPMTGDQFERYLENKYGSVETTYQTVKHYYHDIHRKEIDIDGTVIPEIKNIVDYDTYVNLEDYERSLEYVYDYEDRINESKRNIKIIDSIYIPQILKEKERIFINE